MAAEALPRCRWPFDHTPDWKVHNGVDVGTCKHCRIVLNVVRPPISASALDALQSLVNRRPDPDFPGAEW